MMTMSHGSCRSSTVRSASSRFMMRQNTDIEGRGEWQMAHLRYVRRAGCYLGGGVKAVGRSTAVAAGRVRPTNRVPGTEYRAWPRRERVNHGTLYQSSSCGATL